MFSFYFDIDIVAPLQYTSLILSKIEIKDANESDYYSDRFAQRKQEAKHKMTISR